MTLERSHGKLRPALSRSSDLPKVRAERDPGRMRDAGGRFASGNTIGRGRGWRSLIRKSLGAEATTPLLERLVRDTLTMHAAFVRELPFGGAQVTAPTAARARWTVLSTHLTNRALEVGLETDKGRELLELALKLDQRAERLAVTAFDLATRLAEAERRKPTDLSWAYRDDDGAAEEPPTDGQPEEPAP